MNKYIFGLILIALSFSTVNAQGNGINLEKGKNNLPEQGQLQQVEMQNVDNPIVGEEEGNQIRERIHEQIGSTTQNWRNGHPATGTPETIQNGLGSRRQNIEERRNRIQNMVEERKNQIAKRREEMLQKREAIKVRLEDQRRERVRNLAGNIVGSFRNFTIRLNQLENQLSDLIENQENEDDATEPQNKLSEASDMLDQVMIKIESFSEDFENALDGEITKEYFIEITKEIRAEIIETQKKYQKVVELLNQ